MTARREYALSLAAGLLGGALVVLAAGRSWATVSIREPGIPAVEAGVAGADVAPLVAALGLVLLAGPVVVVATRAVGRRISGACVAVAGVVVVASTLTAGPRLASALRDQLVGGVGGPDLPSQGTPWRWLCLAGALLSCLCGVAAAWRGPRWPVLGARYESPAAPQQPGDPTADLWRATGSGDDPTR